MKAKLQPLFLALAGLAVVHQAAAQGTAFTYQGRLNAGGSPASGSYDLAFSLYATNTGGSPIAAPLTNTAVGVTNGLFLVTLDFGAGAFTGASNWLDISVRTNGGSAFMDLAPRQPLTPAPYAIFAGASGGINGLTIQQNTNGAPNVIGGSPVNFVAPGVKGATISGGGAVNDSGSTYTNSVTADYGTVAGGAQNAAGFFSSVGGGLQNSTAGGVVAVIAGGYENTNNAFGSTIGGGQGNLATNSYATIAGGLANLAGGFAASVSGGRNNTNQGEYATVAGGTQNFTDGFADTVSGGQQNLNDGFAASIGGGQNNQAHGVYATVPGGINNVAAGSFSLAAGDNAQANHDGAFVWADSEGPLFGSTNNDSFNVRAQGGVAFSLNASGDQSSVQFIEEDGFVPSMVVTNNNGNTGRLRFHNFLEIHPNLARTAAGGLDVRDTNSVATIQMNGGSGTIFASSYLSGAGLGAFVTGISNSATGESGSVGGGFDNTNFANSAAIGGGLFNLIQANASSSAISGGQYNQIQDSSDSAYIGGGNGNIISPGSDDSVIGGGLQNTNDAFGSVIAGGVQNIAMSGLNDQYNVIGGGTLNTNNGNFATIAGGGQNTINDAFSQGETIGGGVLNTNIGSYATVAGGISNSVPNHGTAAAIGGGYLNQANADYATVPGGSNNLAGGVLSFAAGGSARATNQGAFVWSDSQGTSFSSTNNDSFNVRAQGGIRFVTGGTGLTVDGAVISGSGNVVTGSGSSAAGVQNTNQADQSVIGGGQQNLILAGADDSVIAGGEQNIVGSGTDDAFIGGGIQNTNDSAGGVIGGGGQNTLGAGTTAGVIGGGELNTNNCSNFGTIAGGGGNIVGGFEGATIVGGILNTNNGFLATIGGGISNLVSANGAYAFVGGGYLNQATATNATVPGGSNNLASGIQSFAAGGGARATNNGAFVWADSQKPNYNSTNNDSFNVRAQGGVRFSLSSTNIGDGNTVQFVNEGDVVPGMIVTNNNGNSGHMRFRNYLEIQPNLAGTTAGGLDVRNTGGIATITMNGANGAVSATSFSGSGSGLTALPAANLTGALPAISGASLTSLPVNAALLNASQSFTSANTFTSTTTMTNSAGGVLLNVFGSRTGDYNSPVAFIENLSTTTPASPALRVQVNTNSPNGVLSVSTGVPSGTANSIIAEFGNSTSFVAVITNDGTIYCKATVFSSDRNVKEHFTALDESAVLAKVAALPVTEWNYKDDAADKKHIGPMAQDFHAAFGLDGDDDKHISTVDEGGVALAAIQGLNQKLEAQKKEKDAEIQALKKQNDLLADRLHELEAAVKLLAAQK